MVDVVEMLTAGRGPTQVATHALLAPLRPVPLEDEALREEIELLLEVIASVADCPGHLTSEQVDATLRLPCKGRPSHPITQESAQEVREPRCSSTVRR